MKKQLTIGAVASRFGVAPWKVRRLYERGLLSHAERLGPYRVINPADHPKMGAALRVAGYLSPQNGPQPQEAARPEGVAT